MRSITFLPLFLLSATVSAEYTQHEAHVHGAGQVNLVSTGNALNVELRLPAINVVGFEYAATTTEQKAAIEQAETSLQTSTQVLVTPAECQLTEASAERVALSGEAEHEHDDEHDKHHDDGHDDEHAKQGKDEHHESHHAEFVVKYSFTCNNAAQLTAIDFSPLFNILGDLKQLSAQAVTEKQQYSQKLSADDSTLQLD